MPRFILLISFIVLPALVALANPKVEISAIEITGNKKTKRAIILRELNFAPGEKFEETALEQLLKTNELRLQNMGLFSSVILSSRILTNSANSSNKKNSPAVIVTISLAERYYLYIVPEVKISGTTFNNWWKREKLSLKYIDGGINIDQKNVSGRNDRLRFSINTGYTNTLKINYKLPYFDKQKIYGLNPKIKYYKNRIALIGSENNLQIFYPDSIPPLLSKTVQSHFEAGLIISRRKDIRIQQSLELRYETNTIGDTILQLNYTPPFFLDKKNQLQFLALRAEIEFNFTDIQFYPQSGWYHKTTAEKNGLGILDAVNQFKIISTTTYYHTFNKQLSALFNVKGQLSLPLIQPYYLTSALGYSDDNIRSYEDYVIDGQHYALARTAFRYKVFSIDIKNPISFLKKIESVPITTYVKSYVELGKVWELPNSATNLLSNTPLPGFGLGLDVTSFYDMALGIEYGFNKRGEHGLVLQFNFKY